MSNRSNILVWITLPIIIIGSYSIYGLFSPSIKLQYYLSTPCERNFHLTDAEKARVIQKIEDGNRTLTEAQPNVFVEQASFDLAALTAHYVMCDSNNISEMMIYFKKYEFIDRDESQSFWISSIHNDESVKILDDFSNVAQKLESLEKRAAANEQLAFELLYGAYYSKVAKITFANFKNLAKALYYSKLSGCYEKEPYSYGSYLHLLYENYPTNKEYMKVAYAMLHYTKLSDPKYFNYSHFDQIEQNLTTLLGSQEIDRINKNYRSIIVSECSGIMSDHNEVPTEDKLNRYAFPSANDRG